MEPFVKVKRNAWMVFFVAKIIDNLHNCCVDKENSCHKHHAICNNPDYSYTCRCKPGFTDDGKRCSDVDECTSGQNECPSNSRCENQVGSFLCPCNDGYARKDQEWWTTGPCFEEDECTTGDYDCNVNAVCMNNEGSYTCQCKAGFIDDGSICMEVVNCKECNGTVTVTQFEKVSRLEATTTKPGLILWTCDFFCRIGAANLKVNNMANNT